MIHPSAADVRKTLDALADATSPANLDLSGLRDTELALLLVQAEGVLRRVRKATASRPAAIPTTIGA